MKNHILFLLVIIFLVIVPAFANAGEDSFTQKDRELLIRLDERLNQIDKRFEQIDRRFEQVDKRFDQIDKRFEQIDKRFEQVDKRIDELRQDMNKRFEQVDKRFESMQTLMMAVIGAFGAIVAVAIGFAVWDRRTMTRPFEFKVKEIEKDIDSTNKKLDNLIDAFRQLAKNDKKVAEILRSFSLL